MSSFKIGILGNFNPNYFPHFRMGLCLNEFKSHFNFSFEWIPTEKILEPDFQGLDEFQGIISGSGPYTSKEGVIRGIRFARKNNIPFMGTCSGFSYAIMEFGQEIFDLKEVDHPYQNNTLPEEEILLAPLNHCDTQMHEIYFHPIPGTKTSRIYNQDRVEEQSHCTYGIHPKKISAFKDHGFLASGIDHEGEPKIMEYSPNDFHIITLFLPQVLSSPQNPHPLISALLESSEKRA